MSNLGRFEPNYRSRSTGTIDSGAQLGNSHSLAEGPEALEVDRALRLRATQSRQSRR